MQDTHDLFQFAIELAQKMFKNHGGVVHTFVGVDDKGNLYTLPLIYEDHKTKTATMATLHEFIGAFNIEHSYSMFLEGFLEKTAEEEGSVERVESLIVIQGAVSRENNKYTSFEISREDGQVELNHFSSSQGAGLKGPAFDLFCAGPEFRDDAERKESQERLKEFFSLKDKAPSCSIH